MSGIQLWVALPKGEEEIEPSFAHLGVDVLPCFRESGVNATVIAGEFMDLRSPVRVCSPLFYVDAKLATGARMTLRPEYAQRAFYVASGSVEVSGHRIEAGQMSILRSGWEVEIVGDSAARVMLLGGEPMSEARHLWWNFVSSSEARIRHARDEWRAGRFAEVPGESEFIPAPELDSTRLHNSEN